MRLELVVALLVSSVAVAARADEGCSKDSECKGDRICVQRQCTDPKTPIQKGEELLGDVAMPRPDAPVPGPAMRPPVTADPKSHRHVGVFIRPDLGFGYMHMHEDGGSIHGIAASVGFAVGGAVSENNILAFHVWDYAIGKPTFESNGTSVTANDETVSLVGVGPQWTTYAAAQNIYFSITPALTRATIEQNNQSSSTNWGFGLRAALGREWWVSDHWGLGVAANLSFAYNKVADASSAPHLTSWAGALTFSATYN